MYVFIDSKSIQEDVNAVGLEDIEGEKKAFFMVISKFYKYKGTEMSANVFTNTFCSL